MKAVVWDGALSVQDDYPRPIAMAGEALVRVTLAGICNTDLEITRGYMAYRGIPGHEFVGVVEEADARPDLVGARVVGEINCGCGSCEWCAAGLSRHCPTRTVLGIAGRDGAFAQYLTLPVANLWPVPDAVDDEAAVFTEPLAASFEVLEQIHLRPGWRVAVLGDGKLGLLMAQVASLPGCEVTAFGKHTERLSFLAARGISTVSTKSRPAGKWDVVVECTGRAEGLALAKELVRPRGTVVLKTTVAGKSEIALAPFVVDEVTVVGSRCGPFAPALRALANHTVDVRPLVAATYPLDEAERAFAHAAGGALKVLLGP
ncbi:MAG: MDR/zinc-dependent alcohol dehydrogenase-like family protein [Chloroflexota bacterium]